MAHALGRRRPAGTSAYRPTRKLAALAQDFNLMASRLRQLLATVETERQRLGTILATMADASL